MKSNLLPKNIILTLGITFFISACGDDEVGRIDTTTGSNSDSTTTPNNPPPENTPPENTPPEGPTTEDENDNSMSKTDIYEGADNNYYYSRWTNPKVGFTPFAGNGSLFGFNLGYDEKTTHGGGHSGISDIVCAIGAMSSAFFPCPMTNENGIVGALDEATRFNKLVGVLEGTTAYAKVNVDPKDGGVCKAGSTASISFTTKGLIDGGIVNAVELKTFYKGEQVENSFNLDLMTRSPAIFGLFNRGDYKHLASFVTSQPYDTIQATISSALSAFGQIAFFHTKCSKGYKAIEDKELDADSDSVPDYIEQILGLRTDTSDSDRDGIDDYEELNYPELFSNTSGNIELLVHELRKVDEDNDNLIDALESGEKATSFQKPDPAWDFYYSNFDNPVSVAEAAGQNLIQLALNTVGGNVLGIPVAGAHYGTTYTGVSSLPCTILRVIPILQAFTCPVTNPSGVASNDLSAATDAGAIAGVASGMGTWARINVPESEGGKCKAGSRAEMVFATSAVVLDHLVHTFIVSTWLGDKLQEIQPYELHRTIANTAAPFLLGVFTDTPIRAAGFITSKEYDAIKLETLGAASVLYSTKFFHARCSKESFISDNES